jgi:hypothetical protein
MLIIPWINGPAWRQEIAIAGRTYVLQARWNPESEHWTLDIADRNEQAIVNGIRLVAGLPLLRLHVDARLPAGDLIVTGDLDPLLDSFVSGESQLVYLTPEDIASAV